MQRTSVENIDKILAFNNCPSLDKLRNHLKISLNLFELNGLIRLTDFSKHVMRLTMEVKTNTYHYIDEQALKKCTNRVCLDARGMGEFRDWTFYTNSYHFIENIILDKPNQVPTFTLHQNSDYLFKLIEKAKFEAGR